jgi:TIR domain
MMDVGYSYEWANWALLLGGVVVMILALRSTRFWVMLPAAIVAQALASSAAPLPAAPGYLLVLAALGAVMIGAGVAFRRSRFGYDTALIGVLIAALGASSLAVALRELGASQGPLALAVSTFGSSVTGAVLLIVAALNPQARRAPIAAVLGISNLSSLFSFALVTLFGHGGFNAAWLTAAAVCAAAYGALLLAPRRVASRMAIYVAICALLSAILGGLMGHFVLVGRAEGVLLTGAAIALARGELFSESAAAANAPAPRARAPAGPFTPHDVFISYKRSERALVEKIAAALRALKLSVWFDASLESGHTFDDEINREVRAAKCVLVCWSQAAIASEWVRAEASIGRERGVLAACFLQRCDLYPPFNLVHAEDLSAGALDAANPAWAKIVSQIGALVGRPGLGPYVALGADRAALGAWIAQYAHDPLAESVLAELRRA